MINKNGKLFGKISVIDIVIVLVILALGAVLVMGKFGRLSLPMAAQKTNIDYVVKLKAYNVEKTTTPPFEVGCSLYSNTGELIGVVTEVTKTPYTIKDRLADGSYFDYESETAYDYYLTAEGSGSVTDKGIFAQGTFALYPNNSMELTSRKFVGGLTVLSVEKKA